MELSLFDPPASTVAVPARRPAPPMTAASRPPATARRPAPTPARRQVLVAVDGNALAHRAYHAYGTTGIADGTGTDRGAVYGFFALLAGICDRGGGDGLVVGFDDRAASRRREAFAPYKATRPQKDPALYALLDVVAAALDDLGVAVVVPPAEEADDVLASAAAVAEASGWRCVVATSDRDAFALVTETTTVLRLRSGLANAVEVTPAVLLADVGVRGEQYLDFSALRGDRSDNLVGVDGIGPARAAALLAAYPGVAEAVADPMGCRSVLGPKLGQALIDDVASDDSVFARNVALMALRRDLAVELTSCARRYPQQRIEATLDAWGLSALSGRLAMALALRPDRVPPPTHTAPAG